MYRFLKRLGYTFYNVETCGHADATGAPILLAHDARIREYLTQQRANGWHNMLLARLPPEAQKRLAQLPPRRRGALTTPARSLNPTAYVLSPQP